jgi:hypothetical protein
LIRTPQQEWPACSRFTRQIGSHRQQYPLLIASALGLIYDEYTSSLFPKARYGSKHHSQRASSFLVSLWIEIRQLARKLR